MKLQAISHKCEDVLLTRIEYQMLFVAFVSMHKSSLVRTNFALDTQVVRGRIILGEISKKIIRLNGPVTSKSKKRSLDEVMDTEMNDQETAAFS